MEFFKMFYTHSLVFFLISVIIVAIFYKDPENKTPYSKNRYLNNFILIIDSLSAWVMLCSLICCIIRIVFLLWKFNI